MLWSDHHSIPWAATYRRSIDKGWYRWFSAIGGKFWIVFLVTALPAGLSGPTSSGVWEHYVQTERRHWFFLCLAGRYQARITINSSWKELSARVWRFSKFFIEGQSPNSISDWDILINGQLIRCKSEELLTQANQAPSIIGGAGIFFGLLSPCDTPIPPRRRLLAVVSNKTWILLTFTFSAIPFYWLII